MGYSDKRLENLVTPEEAVNLSHNHGGINVACMCKQIAEEWGTRYKDPEFNYYCLLAACYTAGYIQAKREERAKASQKKAQAQAKFENDKMEMWRTRTKELLDKADNEHALKIMHDLVFAAFRHWGRTKKKQRQA